MYAELIAQPVDSFRLGDFLKCGFANSSWTEFRSAVAFVKRSGTKHVRDALKDFAERDTKVCISAGIDAKGSSRQGLEDLMSAVGSGRLFVFHNEGPWTFHPKVCVFNNDVAAEIAIGSGNLTEGGLFTNYEASLKLRLDFQEKQDADLFNAIKIKMADWNTPMSGLCYELDNALLTTLVGDGYVPDEQNAWGDANSSFVQSDRPGSSLFVPRMVPPAPTANHVPSPPSQSGTTSSADISPPPSPHSTGTHSVFLMTLQKTDVGTGQTRQGTARRSPEIFIPLAARDMDPEFWGWPSLFVNDPDWLRPTDQHGIGKMDRSHVMVRLDGDAVETRIWYNPNKRDIRIRGERMRSAGDVNDILYIERSNGAGGFDYYAEVVPVGTSRHSFLFAMCTEKVRNSKKYFGYI